MTSLEIADMMVRRHEHVMASIHRHISPYEKARKCKLVNYVYKKSDKGQTMVIAELTHEATVALLGRYGAKYALDYMLKKEINMGGINT